jgi:hypothetical protein
MMVISPENRMLSMIRVPSLAVVLTLTVCAGPAYAQGPAACKPVSAAMTKLFTTDHADTTTSSGTTSQAITAGGVIYVQVKGVWRKSPMTAQDMSKQEEENIRDAKAYTCQAQPDDAGAAVYKTHSESDAGVSDGKIWISKATGLPVKTEGDLLAAGQKIHMSTVYAYTNIHAPIVK